MMVLHKGKIASHDQKARQYIINIGVTKELLQLIKPNAQLSTLNIVTWTLAIILGNTHTNNANIQISNNLMSELLQKITTLLFEIIKSFQKHVDIQRNNKIINKSSQNGYLNESQIKDLEICLTNVLCCISYVSVGLTNITEFWKKILQLLTFPQPKIQSLVFECLTDVIDIDKNHLHTLLKLDLIKHLYTPLNGSDTGIKIKTLSVVSSILNQNNDSIKEMIKCGYIKILLDSLKIDILQMKIITILKQITSKNRDICISLVKNDNIVAKLGDSLSLFKRY